MRFRGKTKSQIYILWQLEYWCCAVQCHIRLIDSQFDSSNKLIASAKKYSLNMFCYHRGSTESRLCECNLHDNQFFMDTCNEAHIKFMICFSGDFFFLLKKSPMSLLTLIKSTPSADPSNLKITEIRQWNFGRRIKLSQQRLHGKNKLFLMYFLAENTSICDWIKIDWLSTWGTNAFNTCLSSN